MNRRGCWLSIVFLLAAVSGCGRPNADSGTSISYWRTLTGGAGDAQDELAERFNDSQDAVQVSVEFQGGYGDLAAKLMTAAAAGTGPDVTQLGTYEIREFARAGVLVDLTEYIEGPNGIDTSDWPGTIRDAGRVDGGLYWLPFNVTVPVLYYNAEAFEEVGLEGSPETWNDLFAAAEKLTNDDRYGLALWESTWPLLSAVWSEGGEVTSTDYSNITIDHPVTVELFTRLQRLVDEGVVSIPAKAIGGHRAAFTSGRAAMILDSPAPYGEIMGQATTFTVKAAQYPSGAAGHVYAPGGGGIAMLARTPGNKRADAWAFMRFLLEPEHIGYYAVRSGYCAFTEASQEAVAHYLTMHELRSIHDSLKHLRGDFSVNMSPAVRNAFDEAFQRIFVRGEDVETVLREADAKAERDVQRELAAR